MKYPIGIFLTGVLFITACTARPTPVTEISQPVSKPPSTFFPSPLPQAAIPTSTTLLQTPTSILQPTSIQKTPPFLLYTPIPTIIPSEEQRMVDLLHSENCKLPCYLGITPGETPWEEAQMILESIGASSSGEWKEGNLLVYGYNLWVGDPSMTSVTPDSNTGVGDLEIAQRIGFTVENDLVQRIGVSIQTKRFVEKYRDCWSRYELWGGKHCLDTKRQGHSNSVLKSLQRNFVCVSPRLGLPWPADVTPKERSLRLKSLNVAKPEMLRLRTALSMTFQAFPSQISP